jgi:hypothetical protein
MTMKNAERSRTLGQRASRSLHAAVLTVVALIAPSALARDPGVNQPGAVGNVGVGAPGRGVAPGVGVGAPGPGVAPGAVHRDRAWRRVQEHRVSASHRALALGRQASAWWIPG